METLQRLVFVAAGSSSGGSSASTRFDYSYLDEPRAELGISTEGMQVYKGLEKRLPRRFLGVRFILQY
jgi:hypothetical protein